MLRETLSIFSLVHFIFHSKNIERKYALYSKCEEYKKIWNNIFTNNIKCQLDLSLVNLQIGKKVSLEI